MVSNHIEVRRSREIEALAIEFKRQEWCAVLAPPLSGRTTLARQVAEEFSRKFVGARFALIDLEPSGTLSELWEQIRRKGDLPGETIPTSSDGRVLLADELASAAQASPKPICLIIDNLDSQPDQVLRLFAAELRRLRNDVELQGSRARLHLILFGGLKLYYLSAGPTSPLHTIIQSVPLADLTSEQMVELFRLRLDVDRVDSRSASALFEETNGHPHLVQCLADALASNRDQVTAETIRLAAKHWCHESQLSVAPSNDCFARIVEFLERYPQTFELVLTMLDGSAISHSQLGRREHLMSGAISEQDGEYRFRGGMIRNALAQYFDPLRRADFATLHGKWTEAAHIYPNISAEQIRQRRNKGTALSRCRMMDLFLNVSPYSMRQRSMLEAIEFVAAAGHHFLGADQVLVWEKGSQSEPANVVGIFPGDVPCQEDPFHLELVESVIRNNEVFSLHSNQGAVCGIGDQSAVTRWALELRFENGLPNDQWFQDGFHNIEPLVFMILDRARQRHADEARSQSQRKLIHDIGLSLLSAKNVDEVFELIVNGVRESLGYECAQLCLVYPEQKELRAVKANGVFDRIKDLTVRSLDGDDPLAVVVREQKPRNVPDTHDSHERCDLEAADLAGIKSFVAVPMLDRGHAVGMLQVGNTSRLDAFNQKDEELLQLLADEAAVAIRLARERDRLTQVLECSGTAMAFIDVNGRIEYRNKLYAEFFNVELQDKTLLLSEAESHEPLVRRAFERSEAITTVRQQGDRSYLVTAAAVVDPFGRYAGGIEVIGTRNPVLGLSESLRDMFTLTEHRELEQAIVKCLVQRLGYSRARLYRSIGADRLASSCSMGMSSDSAKWFDSGKAILHRNPTNTNGDGFECMRRDGPLIFVNQALNFDVPAQSQPHFVLDKLSRPIIVVDLKNIAYTKELEKEGLPEWVEVPLGTPSQPLGKLSVDLKGSVRHLGLEDVEILALFGRWASDALARNVAQERVQEQAKYVRDARVVGDRRGLEAMVWDFLLNITSEGGPGFNRAAVFLRNPQTGLHQGFLCHGAADLAAWGHFMAELPTLEDRRQFLIDARREKMSSAVPTDEQKRLEVFRRMVVQESDSHSEFAAAVRQKGTVMVRGPNSDLTRLYRELAWQEADEALLCPLLSDGDCEGLVYADRAFIKDAMITASDADLLESYSYNLAMIARPLRLAEQLRSRILGVTHTTISPVAAIRALAEGLKPRLKDPEQREIIDLVMAEAQRSADLFRRLLRAAAGGTMGLAPKFRQADLISVLKTRIQPYQFLLKTDEVIVELRAPEVIGAEFDPDMLGDVFAELAANASMAIQHALDIPRIERINDERRSMSPSLQKSIRKFGVNVEVSSQNQNCQITFENSGPTIAVEAQANIWDRFVSASGGTGIGLWLVKEIIGLHHGKISYRISDNGLSTFELTIPLHHEASQ